MDKSLITNRVLLLFVLSGALLLGACGPITIDVGGGGANSDGNANVANQFLFILMIVLLVAMFAMVFVAMSSR